MEYRNGYELLTPSESVQRKQNEIKKAFAAKKAELAVDGILMTQERKHIVSLSFGNLKQELVTERLSAVEVLRAYQAKALVETEKTNCITELIPQAEKWAEELDRLPKKQRGILHGIPISIKENFDVDGMDSTMGLTRRLGKPAKRNSAMVEVLLSQGAVPFVKTNIVQLLFNFVCSNPVFGETMNPYDITRTSGGSTGGEGALITGGGSLVGLGSDLAGSVRIPSLLCGTCSIKCTRNRLSRDGLQGAFSDSIGVYNSIGFLGRDVEGLAIVLRSLLTTDYIYHLDPKIPQVYWRDDIYHSTTKLTVGWFDTNSFFPCTPGVRRAVLEAKTALEKMGHSTVMFEIPDMSYVYDLYLDFILSEGGVLKQKFWEDGEIVDKALQSSKQVQSTPWWAKRMLHAYVSWWSPMMSKFLTYDTLYSSALWAKIKERAEYTEKLLDAWKTAGIDVLLSPGFPTLAFQPDHIEYIKCGFIYSGIYNLVDFPSGTVPVTFENSDDQRLLEQYPTDDYVYKCVKEAMKGATGMPLGVQIASLPYQEEMVLYAMKELELALRGQYALVDVS